MRLNEQQQKIVNNASGKVAVIAGAGSGKTTVVVELILKLHQKDNIPIEDMFISTFTNKAGREIKERLKKRGGFSDELLGKLWVGTFHGLGYRYLKNIQKKNLNIILPVESEFYLKNVYKQVVGEIEDPLLSYDKISGDIENKRNKNLRWEDVSDYPDVCKEIYKIYQEEKDKSDLVDFTDILNMFAQHLEEDISFRNKFKWVFIDESQDSNHFQNKISDLLTTKNVIYVGDSKQSLYKWRGASPEIFKKRIATSDIIFSLTHNYRSTQSILNFANKLLEQFPQFKGQELIATGDLGEKPTFFMCDSLAKTIFESIKKDIKNGISLHEIAVLSRSVKSMNIGELEILLRAARIPYTVRGGKDKLNAAYVQTYLSILKSIVNPTRISLLNALSILPSIGPKTASKLADSVLEDGDFFALSGVKAKYSETKAYQSFMHLTTLTSDSKELLLRSFDFIADHYLTQKYKDTASQKREIIFKLFFDNLLGFSSLTEGIDSLYINEEDAESDKDKVIISTVHQCVSLDTLVETSNGLVFIADIPEEGQIATPSGIQEYKDKFKREKSKVLKIITKNGYTLKITIEHGITVWNKKEHIRCSASDLKVGDLVRLKVGETFKINSYFKLNPLCYTYPNQYEIDTPEYLTEDLAELLGILVADGTIFEKGFRVSKGYKSHIDRVEQLCLNLFNKKTCRNYISGIKTGCYLLDLNSVPLILWLEQFNGLKPKNKDIPFQILQSPSSIQYAFLRGLFEDGSIVVDSEGKLDHIRTDSVYPELVRKLQVMLLRLDIVSVLRKGNGMPNNNTVYLFGENALKFKKYIGCISEKKKNLLNNSNPLYSRCTYYIPISKEESLELKEKFPTTKDYNNCKNRGKLSRIFAKKMETNLKKNEIWERMYWHYDTIASIEETFEETMCLTVSQGSRFLQNGFDGWNSKGLEFDSVHIANFQEFAIPYINEEEEAHPVKLADKLEEEFCLAYVASTRARKHLNMYVEYITGLGSYQRKNKLSRFIKRVLKTSGEKIIKFRMLDVEDESAYKDSVFRNIAAEVKK